MKREQDQSTEEIVRRWIDMDRALANRQGEGLYMPEFCKKWGRKRATIQRELKIFEGLFKRETEVCVKQYYDCERRAESRRSVHFYKEAQNAVFVCNLSPVEKHLLPAVQNVVFAQSFMDEDYVDAFCEEVKEFCSQQATHGMLRKSYREELKKKHPPRERRK